MIYLAPWEFMLALFICAFWGYAIGWFYRGYLDRKGLL